MTKTIAAQGLKLQLQKLQNKNSVLEDRNERLELSANQVPGLKANIKTIIKKNRQNELDIFDFKTNLEETTANLKKTKQKLVTQQFKMGVLTTTRNKLRTRLELTSSQLQHKNRAFVQERDVKLDLLKELRAKNSKIHTHDQEYNQLLLSLERTSMREENIRTEYKNVLDRYALDQQRRDQIMNDADAALNKEKALQQLIQSLEQEIIKEQQEIIKEQEIISTLELELIQEKNARSVTNIKLNEAHDALAHAASEIAHLKQDIKGHETDKTELRLAADLALQQKMEADESSMIAADASRRSRCRAEAADEERRRTAIDFKAIEDGLRTRIISSRKDVDELELKKMEMENNYIAEIDQLNQINSNMNIKNQNITGRLIETEMYRDQILLKLDQTIERAEKSENIVTFVMHGIRNVTEDCVVKRKNVLANETENKCYCLDKSMFDLENVQNKKAKNKKNKNKKDENLFEDNEKKEDEENDLEQEINDHIEILTDDTTNVAASLLNQVSQHLSAIHLSWTTASNKIISLKKEINSSHQRASEQIREFRKNSSTLETEKNKLQKKYTAQQKEFKDVQAALDCKVRELQNETASSLMLAVEAKRIQEVANLSLEEIHQLKLKEKKERQLILKFEQEKKEKTENQRTTGMNTMEEDKDSETLGRAKWLMDAASKAAKQAMEAQEAIEAMKSIQLVTTDIGTQVEERSTVNAECQTLENFWNEKKMETKRNEQNEQDEPDGLNAQNERQQRTEEDNDRNDKETDNTIQIHVTLVEKPTLSINTNGKGNQDDNRTGRKNEIKNGLTKNLENNLHVDGPPAFVAAALCRAFARMDDPAMFNAMWSSRGGGWSFKTNTSSFITTTKGNASTSTANANSQEFRKWSIEEEVDNKL